MIGDILHDISSINLSFGKAARNDYNFLLFGAVLDNIKDYVQLSSLMSLLL